MIKKTSQNKASTRSKINYFLGLSLSLFLVSSISYVQAQSAWTAGQEGTATIYLTGASRDSLPLVVIIQTGKGGSVASVVTSPYVDASSTSRGKARGCLASYAIADGKVSGWKHSSHSLAFSISGQFEGESSSKFQASVDAKVEGARIIGTWKGNGNGGAKDGQVLGTWTPGIGIATGAPVFLVVQGPRTNWAGRAELTLGFVNQGGKPSEGYAGGGPVGSAYNTSKYPKPVLESVGMDGRRYPFISMGSFTQKSMSGEVKSDSFHLKAQLDGDVSGDYSFEGKTIGRYVVGTGKTGSTTMAMAGWAGLPKSSTLPPLKFGNDAERLHSAALWAFTSPEMGGIWASDPMAGAADGTSEKQYDNFFENAYGGIASMVVLAKISPDPDVAHEAKLRALRAGWAMLMRGKLHDDLAHYYKGMFWLAAWGPMGALDLHAMTGDAMWLERAVKFAKTLERIQMPEGTWTYFDEIDGSVGKSNERKDRSFDNRPLQCGEHLLFLGRLRVEHGVKDFEKVETKAREWMTKAFEKDPASLFKDRRPGDAAEARGAVLLAQYLAVYAPDAHLKDARKVMDYIEKNFVDAKGIEITPGFKPAVLDYYPRWGHQDRPAPSTDSTTRLAIAYQALAKRGGSASDKSRAEKLIEAVYKRQTKEGMIHHLGRMDLSADHEERINHKNAAMYDQHQMSVMRAATIYNLYLHANEGNKPW